MKSHELFEKVSEQLPLFGIDDVDRLAILTGLKQLDRDAGAWTDFFLVVDQGKILTKRFFHFGLKFL